MISESNLTLGVVVYFATLITYLIHIAWETSCSERKLYVEVKLIENYDLLHCTHVTTTQRVFSGIRDVNDKTIIYIPYLNILRRFDKLDFTEAAQKADQLVWENLR